MLIGNNPKEQSLPTWGDSPFIREVTYTWENINEFIEYYRGKDSMVDRGYYFKQTYMNIGDPNPEGKEYIFHIFNKVIRKYANENNIKLKNIICKYGFQLTPQPFTIFGNGKTAPTVLHFHYNFYLEFDSKRIMGIKKFKSQIQTLMTVLGLDYCVYITKQGPSYDFLYGYYQH